MSRRLPAACLALTLCGLAVAAEPFAEAEVHIGRPMFYYTMYTDADLAAIKGMYDQWQPLKHLQLEFIHEHVELAPGATATRYENGEEVVCNASASPYAYRGTEIAPRTHRLFAARP